MAQIGDVIGNYRLVEVLSNGGFGQVFRAQHVLISRRQVAIKFLRQERLHEPQEREQFLQEADILNQLRHPSILPLIDAGLENDVPYIVTEYAAGKTLRAYLKQRAGRPVELEETLRLIEPVARALQFAHDNHIVHRDLKPENILFDEHHQPLLADFGIAVVLATNKSFQGNISGTAPYMAPEQFKGKIYPESDQYALGCLLYEMLTGRQPFQAPEILALGFLHVHEPPTPPRQLNPRLPISVEAALLKALAKEREQRHSSILALLDALRPAVKQSAPEPQMRQSIPPAVPGADDDDDMVLPPVTPRQPGGKAPETPGGGAAPAGPHTPDSRRGPTALFIGQQPNTPRPGGSGKLPATGARGSQTRSGTGKQPSVTGRNAAQQRPENSTLQLAGSQQRFDEANSGRQSVSKSGNTGKTAAVVPAALAAGAAPGVPTNSGLQNISPTITAAPGGPHQAQRSTGLTPLPPPVSPRLRRGLLLTALLLLMTALVVWLIVSANGISSLASLGHLTATVSITPQSRVEQNGYLLTGLTSGPPNADKREVSARVITAQSDTKQGQASSTGSIPATAAQGVLTFQNVGATAVTLGTTVLTGADGVAVKFGPVSIPAAGSTTTTAYAVNAGTAGNIRALDINESCCYSGITVRNSSAFTGGQDAQPNSVITQNDINHATNVVMSQLKTSTLAAMKQQIKSNEHVVDGSLNCTPTTTADHKAGDVAKSVTVSVSVTCTEEVFDYAAAQQIASHLLSNSVPLKGYQLVGSIITTLKNSSVVDAQNQVSITIQAAGRWVYQFTDQELQQIKTHLVNKSKDQALIQLRDYAGLTATTITISYGSTLPANISDITVNVVPVAGLQPSPPTTGENNTPASGATPVPSPTNTPEGQLG